MHTFFVGRKCPDRVGSVGERTRLEGSAAHERRSAARLLESSRAAVLKRARDAEDSGGELSYALACSRTD